VRNRLHPSTVFQITQVKYNVHRTYNKDKSSAIERRGLEIAWFLLKHTRVDAPRNDDSSDNSEEEEEESKELDSNDSHASDSTDEESNDDLFGATAQDGGPESSWLNALQAVEPDIDDDDEFDLEEVEEPDCDSDDDGSNSDNDECYEKRRHDLKDLPADNDKKYPQEDARYFLRQRSKQCVRTDKYKLSMLCAVASDLPNEVKIPTIMRYTSSSQYH